MTGQQVPPAKEEKLKRWGTLNPRPETVTDPLFESDPFFDARDLIQVRYEMVRRVQVGRLPVTVAARVFGCTRQTFYKAKGALEEHGLSGLVPKKRGPRGPHKLKGEALAAVLTAKQHDPSLSPAALADMVLQRFGLSVHSRTVGRVLAKQEKKRR